MILRNRWMIAVALVALGQAPAYAQLIQCRGDVQKFCQGTPPGGGRIIRCLEQNTAKLSEGCRSALGARSVPGGAAGGSTGGAGSAKTACRGDATRFCSDAVGNQAKMKECLRSHAAELSDGCKTALIAAGS